MSIFSGNTNGHHSLHLVRWTAIVVAVWVALSLITGLFNRETSHAARQAAPAPRIAAVATPAPASTASPSPARGATTTVAPIALGPALVPPQAPPAHLLPGRARVALASAQHQAGPWVALGAVNVRAPTAVITTRTPKALAAVAPSSGLIRLRWSGWIDATAVGSYTLAVQVAGGPATVTVTVDGVQAVRVARSCGWMGVCPSSPTSGAGSIGLAAGWHEITATAIAPAGQVATATLYEIAPGGAAPTVITTSAPAVTGATP